jgi:chloride channel 3/4/5
MSVQVKESSRVRRLRHNASRSMRGRLLNTWDRFQGWLVVNIIGIILTHYGNDAL